MTSSDPKSAWRPPALGEVVKAKAGPTIEEEAARIRKKAHAEGYAEGVAAGRARAESTVAELSALLQAMATPFQDADAALVRELVGLVERVAAAVIGRELEAGAYDLEQLIARSLDALGSAKVPIELRMNPADAALCRQHGFALAADQPVEIVEDGSLQRGGIHIRAGPRVVDASVEARLAEAFASLRNEAGIPEPALEATGDE
ncbi:MAG: FliH/SctL family protein [Halieaceae bacterium]|jgi:flagellar assembly protein FliH|nr:FliH/SctL family protein [Halieaceae bacterium]